MLYNLIWSAPFLWSYLVACPYPVVVFPPLPLRYVPLHLARHSERRRRQGRQRKRWEDNIREWTGLEFAKSQRTVENREKWRKLIAKSSVVPQRPSRLRDRWWWWWVAVRILDACPLHGAAHLKLASSWLVSLKLARSWMDVCGLSIAQGSPFEVS